MRIATWNVNSIRSRIDRVEAWLARSQVDVLAIQESKAKDEQFPYDRFRALGYQVAHHGVSQWNGVAIASRVGTTIPGWTSTVLIVAGVGAVQLFCLGLLGEYVGRMYTQMQGRPSYFIAYDSLNLPAPTASPSVPQATPSHDLT